MSEPVVSGRGLTVRYRTARRIARAVDDVDIDVAAGEVLALAGESGCGKTSLARTLLGLQKPDDGTVSWRGEPLTYSTRSLRGFHADVQFVPQDPAGSLNPRQRVFDAVAEGPRIHNRPDVSRRVSEALEWVGLTPVERFAHSYPRQLSGGQKQRVLIAGALALRPSLVIADEPVASLDASVRGEILALLLRLRDDFGTACLVVTHDLSVAWSISDRTAVMYAGRIVETGDTEQVLTRPRHPYTRALQSVLPASGREATVLAGEAPDVTAIAPGCRFHPRCPELADGTAEAAGVAGSCRDRDLAVVPAGGSHVACHLHGD
ncbi:MAG: ABC transporter ATP-binding protein [Stackebrandtia sp.]